MLAERGLWAGPYFSSVFGLEPVARGGAVHAAAQVLGPILPSGVPLVLNRARPGERANVGSALKNGASTLDYGLFQDTARTRVFGIGNAAPTL